MRDRLATLILCVPLLLVVSANGQLTPGEGQKVQPGSLITGPCEVGHIVSDKPYDYITGAEKSIVNLIGFGTVGEIEPTDCKPVLVKEPGHYTLEKLTGLGTRKGGDNAQREVVNFEVVLKPCDVQAKDGNTGRPISAAEMKQFGFEPSRSGSQTLRTGAKQRLSITMHDGTEFRLGPNSEAEFDPCEELTPAEPTISVKLVLGTIWAHIVHAAGNDENYRVDTERAVVGVRGTTFEVSDDGASQTTRVKVIEGTVNFRPIGEDSGIMVRTGQSAVLKDGEAPRLVNH